MLIWFFSNNPIFCAFISTFVFLLLSQANLRLFYVFSYGSARVFSSFRLFFFCNKRSQCVFTGNAISLVHLSFLWRPCGVLVRAAGLTGSSGRTVWTGWWSRPRRCWTSPPPRPAPGHGFRRRSLAAASSHLRPESSPLHKRDEQNRRFCPESAVLTFEEPRDELVDDVLEGFVRPGRRSVKSFRRLDSGEFRVKPPETFWLLDAELWTRLVDLDVTPGTELVRLEEGDDAGFTNCTQREREGTEHKTCRRRPFPWRRRLPARSLLEAGANGWPQKKVGTSHKI